MIDKWKRAVNSNNVFVAILTDLSKTFDCICPDLLLAKLHAHGLSLPALKIIQDYLINQNKEQKLETIGNMKIDITLTVQMTRLPMLSQTIQQQYQRI